jgi:N-acetylglutamate synthase-like GNAT family acetyltransferase
MHNVRKAHEGDESAIRAILDELDLAYPGMALRDFWIMEAEAGIVAVGRMEMIDDKLFLSSLGVRESHRNRGLAKKLFETMIEGDNRDVYIYTVIPEYFEKLGFVISDQPDSLPEREQFGCERCEPERCVCMVRPRHVA